MACSLEEDNRRLTVCLVWDCASSGLSGVRTDPSRKQMGAPSEEEDRQMYVLYFSTLW